MTTLQISNARGAGETKEVLKCGVVAAETGPLAPTGVSIKNSILLAAKQNSNSNRLQFIFEDDQFTPSKTVSAMRKLLELDHVSCFIVFGSSTSMAIVDIVERAHIPTISIAITPKVTEGREFVLRDYVPVESQAEVINAAIKKSGYSDVSIITSLQDGPLALRDQFLATKATKVLLDEEINPEDRDFRSLATKIKSLNPKAVFLNVLPPQLSIVAKQLRAIGYIGDFFSGPPLGNPTEIFAADGALQGAWFVSLDNSNAKTYYDDYFKEFSDHPSVEGIYGYDAANFFIAGSMSDLLSFFKTKKEFQGLLGHYPITGHTLNLPAGLWHVTKNGFEYCGSAC